MPIQDSGVITASSFLQKTNFNDNICYVDKLSTKSKDNFQGGYGIKLLVSNYSGPMVNVRRGNDNATLDFYGDENGNLGTEYNANGTTLISWLADSVGYVKILYDQSGNGRHVKSNSNSTDPFITPSPIKEMLSVSGQTAVRSMFCLFRASSAYTGPTVQLRRESDNNIQDFYADINYNLTTGINGTGTTFRSWVGASTGRVTIWYDQSGNGNHAIQPTTTLQPYLDRNSIVFSRIIFDVGRYLQSNTTTNSIGIPATTDSSTATSSSWSINGTTSLTLTTVATGTFKVGMTLAGTNITGSPKILYFSSGTGGNGSVAVLSVSQGTGTFTNTLTGTPALNYTFIFNHQYLSANSILFSNSINQLSIDRNVYLTNTLSNKKFTSYNQLAIYDGTKSVVTYSPSNHNIYVNGNVNNNTTDTTNTPVTASGTQYIGTNSTALASNTFCELDTIFIFDDQLSTEDRVIASSFNLGSPGYNILYNANSFLVKSISPTDLVCEYPPNGLITTGGTTTITGQFSDYNGTYIISTSAGDGSLALREDYTSFWSPGTSYNTSTGRVDSPANTTTINGIVYGGGFIQIQLPIAIVLKTYSLAGHSSTFASSSPRQFFILGNNNLSPANNDSGWVLVDSQDGINDWDNRDKIFKVKNNVSSFRVFRLYVREISNSYTSSSSTLSLGRFKLNPVNGIPRGSKTHSVISDSNCLTNQWMYTTYMGTSSNNSMFGTFFNQNVYGLTGWFNDRDVIPSVPLNSQRKIVTTMNNNLNTNNITVYDNFSIHQNTSPTPSALNLAYLDFRIGSRENSFSPFLGFINEVLVFSNTLNENDALMYFQGINAGVTIKENPKSKLNLSFDSKLNSTPLPSNPFILLTMDNLKFGSNNTTDTIYQGTVNPSKLIKSWGDFNCSAQIVSITSITTGAGPIITTSAAHNYMVGITVSFYDTNSTPVINNTYTINTVPSTTTFTVTSPPTITVAGTSGYIIPYGPVYEPKYGFIDYRYFNSAGVGGTGYESNMGQIHNVYTTGFKSTISRAWTPATSGFTVVCTILNDDDSTDKPIFFIGNTGNLNNSISAYKGANVRYYFTIRGGSGTDLALATTRNNFADRSKWDLMVFRYTESDKSYEIYRNGTLEGRAIGTVSPGNITTNNNLLSMNNSVRGKFWFSGFAAYNKSLSLEEITNVSNHLLWSSNFSTQPNLTQNIIRNGLTYNVPGLGSIVGRFHDPNSFYEIRDVPDLPISLSVRFCAHTFTNVFARTINWSISDNILTVNAIETDSRRLEVGMTLFTSAFTARPIITSIVSGMGSDVSVYTLDSSPGTFSSTTVFLSGLWHYMSIISLTDSSNVTSTTNISLDYDQYGKRLLVRSQTSTYSISKPLEDISVNTWYHITVTISETCKIMCYINGALVKIVRSAQIPSSRCRILLGKSSQTDITKRFNGYLKDFKVYDYILRKDQIAQMVYSSNLQVINTGNSKNNFLINNLTFNKTTINDTNQISSSKYIRNQEVFCALNSSQRLLYNNERIQDYKSFRLSFDFIGRDYGADSDGFVMGHTGVGSRVNTMEGPGIIIGFRSFGDRGVYLRINGISVRYVNNQDWARNIPINIIVVYNRSYINTFSVYFNGVLIMNYSMKNIEEWIGISGNYWSFYSETGGSQHISNIKNVQLDYVPYLDKTKSGSGSEILGNFGSVGNSGTPGSGYSLGALVKAGYSSGSIGDMRNKQRGLLDGLTWKLYDGYLIDPKLYKYQAIGRGTKFSSIENCTQDTLSTYSTSYNNSTHLIQQLSGTAQGAMRGMYALYRLSNTYTGPTITLRSNKTNVGQDFYADINGNLTTGINGTGISFRAWYDTECACNYTVLDNNTVQIGQHWNNESGTSPYTWGVLITGRDQNPLLNGYYRVISSSEFVRDDLFAYNVFNSEYISTNRWWHINPYTYNGTTGDYTGSTTTTVSSVAQLGEWLQLQIPNALRVTSFVISADYNNLGYWRRFLKSFVFAGSNDGTTWTSIFATTNAQIDKYGGHPNNITRSHFFDCSGNTSSYSYYRIIGRSMIGGFDGALIIGRLKLNAYIPTATEKAKVRVTKWWDQSGLGIHATQEENLYLQPIYNPDSNTVDFGGNDQSYMNLGIHTQFVISSVTFGTTITVTTTVDHGFIVGSVVTIINAVTGTGTTLNGAYTVDTVPTTTTFTITLAVAISSYNANSGTVSTPTNVSNPVSTGRPSYTFVAKLGKFDKAQRFALFGAGNEANYSRLFLYTETNGWSYQNWYNDEVIGPEVYEDSTLTLRYDRTNRIGYLNGVQQQNYSGGYSSTNLNIGMNRQYIGNFPNFDQNYTAHGQMKSLFIFSSAADSNGALSDADRKLCEEDTFSLSTTIEFVGYFLPPVTANYTFSVNNVDDIARGWIGANANNGYTANNTTFSASLTGNTLTTTSGTVSMVKNTYYPIRMLYSQNTAFNQFQLSVSQSTPLLDKMSSAGKSACRGAYALFLLNNSYTEPIITLRSNVNSVIQQFYATTCGLLTTTGINTGTNYQTWLLANNSTFSYVTQWWDQSGNGRHATQPTTTLQPTYSGTDSIDFGGQTNAYLLLGGATDGPIPYGNNPSFTSVVKQGTVQLNRGSGAFYSNLTATINRSNVLRFDGAAGYKHYFFNNDTTCSPVRPDNILTVTYDGVNLRKMYINNIYKSQTSSAYGNIVDQQQYLGAATPSLDFLNGEISSAMFFNTVLSDSDLIVANDQNIFDFSGEFFSSNGTISTLPAESAKIIKDISNTNIDGIYYISCGGVSTPIYCLMNDVYNGGGWMMLMKGLRGSTFQYSSTHWTTTSTLNPSDTTLLPGDSKYDTFNYSSISDVMAIFPDIKPKNFVNLNGTNGGSLLLEDGWCWKVDNWGKTLPMMQMLSTSGYNSARAMYALVLVNKNYTGPTIRLDGVDYYADVSGEMNTSYNRTGTNFYGTTGLVDTWYDQSGNGRHATQTLTNRPFYNGSFIDFSTGKFLNAGAAGDGPFRSNATANSWNITNGTTLTLTTVSAGKFSVGLVLSGTGISGSPVIVSFTSGSGGSGSVALISVSQTNVTSTNTLTGSSTNLPFTYIYKHGNFSSNLVFIAGPSTTNQSINIYIDPGTRYLHYFYFDDDFVYTPPVINNIVSYKFDRANYNRQFYINSIPGVISRQYNSDGYTLGTGIQQIIGSGTIQLQYFYVFDSALTDDDRLVAENNMTGNVNITPLEGFNTSRDAGNMGNPLNFTGNSSSIFSYQANRRHVFGGGSHVYKGLNPSRKARWGIMSNNENDFQTCDSNTGIGLTESMSAGDFRFINDGTTGLQRSFLFQMYGR